MLIFRKFLHVIIDIYLYVLNELLAHNLNLQIIKINKKYFLLYPTVGTIVIQYSFRSGIQGLEHPNPGI
jgi:hypothetical protein